MAGIVGYGAFVPRKRIKSEEIANIFSDGPQIDLVALKETLNKVAPFYSSTWNEINY